MKKYFLATLISILITQPVVAGKYARQANQNPFLNGELNAKYEGEESALAGVIIEIHTTKENHPIYKVNLNIDGINPIWVTSIAPPPNGGINVGDGMVFKGFISTAAELDSSGDLEELISSKTLLMAMQSQRAN